jgi:hypothetical protein
MVKRARKKYWIDRQIQGALAIRVALHWLIFSGVATALTLMFQYLGSPLAPFSEHVSVIWTNQGPFALVMLMLLPVFLYDTVKLSNRFAGPVLRLRRAMTGIANGEPAERLNFRDNDFWRGMADDYNVLVDRGYFDGSPSPVENSEPELQEVGA